MNIAFFISSTRPSISLALVASLLLVPITYFLAESNSTSFIPTYFIALGIIAQLFSQRMMRILHMNTALLTIITIFFVYMLVTNFWQTNLTATLKPAGYVLLILTFLVSIPLTSSHYKNFPKLFLQALLVSATISAILSLWGYFGLDYRTADEGRLIAFGGLDNPVMSGLSYGAACIINFSYLTKNRSLFERYLSSASLLIILTALLLTETRSALIGLLVGGVAITFVYRDREPLEHLYAFTKYAVGLILLVSLAYYVGYFDVLLERSTSFRPEIWKTMYVHLSLPQLITGMGTSTDASVFYAGELHKHPHSIYFSTVYYGGVIGLVGMLTMFGYALFQMTKLDRSIMIYAIPLFIYGLICLTVDGNRIIRKIDFIWLMIWLPIGLSMIRSSSQEFIKELED
ncbi:MAG: O-antigen ligase family protein [Pseudomonadales bacterium]|nr:O-antigen ligase family protein [Pseudomonadales bacterium]MDG1442220.1 O-antigen ligase family protein [Pseudomonadales bacterium]